MTELDQGSSHIQVIDANPIKGIMNKQMIKVKKMQGVLYVQIVYLDFKTSECIMGFVFENLLWKVLFC